jgi:hypothetical protein
MAIKDYLPFVQNSSADFFAKTIEPDQVQSLSKALKPAALALGFRGTTFYYNVRATFEPSPYNFERLLQAIDTDSYVKQATLKYKELFWKEGWTITGENPEAVAYLYQRIDFMEIAMKRPISEFFIEVSDNLIKFSNVFIVKARVDMSEYFPTPLNPINGSQPIIGYYLIPTEQVRILRDKHNRPKSYRQQTSPWTYMPTDRDPVWDAEKVVHLHFDKKAGRAFGTPFMSAAMDDVIALRQLEEDIQNLVHRELFPLYKYKIGTAEQPAEPDEIDRASSEIESMRSEGGLILPYRHDVEVIGANGTALNAEGYLQHFKERVAIGLGVFPHHLGMTAEANRSATERLDTALYDKIKQYQKQFAEMVRLHFFNELLFEGGFDPITNPMSDGVSDRCFFKFHEIDVDTQVKKETHIIQKYTNSVISLSETRTELGIDPEADISELFPSIQADIQSHLMEVQAGINAKNQPQQDNTPKVDPTTQNSDKQQPASKGQRNMPSKRKGAGNIIRPTNQQGRRTSPDIKRSDLSWLPMIENALKEEYNVIEQDEVETKEEQKG